MNLEQPIFHVDKTVSCEKIQYQQPVEVIKTVFSKQLKPKHLSKCITYSNSNWNVRNIFWY
jgi:hypothetical protein